MCWMGRKEVCKLIVGKSYMEGDNGQNTLIYAITPGISEAEI